MDWKVDDIDDYDSDFGADITDHEVAMYEAQMEAKGRPLLHNIFASVKRHDDDGTLRIVESCQAYHVDKDCIFGSFSSEMEDFLLSPTFGYELLDR